jgi:hypothetical protein
MRKLTRKQRSIVLGLVGLLTMTGAAFGFFTTVGDGTGSTRAGTSTALTISATITPGTGGIVPGGLPAAIAFSVGNTGQASQHVDTIHLVSVEAFTDAAHTATAAGCDTSYFSVADVTANQTVPTGTTAITAPGSLVFTDSGTSQDACKLAYLLLTFSSN